MQYKLTYHDSNITKIAFHQFLSDFMIWQPTTLQGFQQKRDAPHFIALPSLSLVRNEQYEKKS